LGGATALPNSQSHCYNACWVSFFNLTYGIVIALKVAYFIHKIVSVYMDELFRCGSFAVCSWMPITTNRN